MLKYKIPQIVTLTRNFSLKGTSTTGTTVSAGSDTCATEDGV